MTDNLLSGLSPSDLAHLAEVSTQLGRSPESLVAEGVRGHLKRLSSASADNRGAGSASLRIRDLVQSLMAYNHLSPARERFYIGISLVGKLTGANAEALRQYFDFHRAEIEAHNSELGLEPQFNRGRDLASLKGYLKETPSIPD